MIKKIFNIENYNPDRGQKLLILFDDILLDTISHRLGMISLCQ